MNLRGKFRPRRACALALAACANLADTGHAAAPDCARDGELRFSCGIALAEDSAGLPGTRWVLGGGLGYGQPGRLQALHTGTGEVRVLYPRPGADTAAPDTHTDCPAAPDPATLSIGGLALGARAGGGRTLYAVNEGARRAVEMFRVRLRGAGPELSWTGCVPLPAGTNPNAVAALPDGGFAVVSMDDGGADRMARHEAGAVTGRVFEWLPGQGLRELPALPLRGGNGIEASRDGRWLFVSAWAGGELWRIDRLGQMPPQRRALGFLPDNVKRAPDGTLWLAGQRPPLARIARCTGNPCPADWVIARVDAATLDTRIVLERAGDAAFNYATGAVEHRGELFINGRGQDRVARIALRALRTPQGRR